MRKAVGRPRAQVEKKVGHYRLDPDIYDFIEKLAFKEKVSSAKFINAHFRKLMIESKDQAKLDQILSILQEARLAGKL